MQQNTATSVKKEASIPKQTTGKAPVTNVPLYVVTHPGEILREGNRAQTEIDQQHQEMKKMGKREINQAQRNLTGAENTINENQLRLINARRSEKNNPGAENSANDNNYKEAAKSLKKVAQGSKSRALYEGSKLAFKMRKAAANHEESPWIIALAFAIAVDAADSFQLMIIILIFFRIFLFIFLWGKGTWFFRLIMFILLSLECFPILNMLPMTTCCVLYAYAKSKKKVHDLAAKAAKEA